MQYKTCGTLQVALMKTDDSDHHKGILVSESKDHLIAAFRKKHPTAIICEVAELYMMHKDFLPQDSEGYDFAVYFIEPRE